MTVKSALVAARYAPSRSEEGEWSVVDQERADQTVVTCPDAPVAALVAGLMNGDLAAFACVSPETLAQCRATLGGALHALRPAPRPAGRLIERAARGAPAEAPLVGTFH